MKEVEGTRCGGAKAGGSGGESGTLARWLHGGERESSNTDVMLKEAIVE